MKLSQRVEQLAESATLAVSAKAARMQAAGIDVVGFGAGEPDFDTPQNIKRAAINAIESGMTKYAKPASGIPIAKSAICEKFKRENGLTYAPDQTIVTAGGKMGVYLVVQAVVEPGDEVVIPVPYWVSYPEITALAGGKPVYVAGPEERDYKLTPEVLRSALTDRTRLFFFNSPSNPSSVTYHPDEVRALATVLEDRDIWVLSDEIYDRLLFDGQQTLSFAAASDKAFRQTLTLNAASKAYAMTGWRVGYAAGPKPLIDAMIKLQSQTTSGAATFNHVALAAALTQDQSAVEHMRVEFERRAHYMYRRMTAIPGVRCPKPTGAFYCFPNVSGTYKRLGVSGSIGFAERLLEEARVAVVPGVAFGLDEHVRFSFALSMEQIEKGLSRLEQFLR
ncbi:MAG: pyridoxal phosphate-dependent aminotransferase [Planctomycetes bacterium]|nr:pyridoxal phosphate-dependent aminotransferase [Planctomycetota bacterium]